mmetsp:Transcript_36190/g.6480  ORF Transcript_36190/g.6480 Transcript_36190/m.6480 type:complete len:90 (-) Transcript_36190:14-283(-)
MAMAELNCMPLLVESCKLCPRNIEGSVYALLMSTINMGQLVSYQLGSLLMVILGITQSSFGNLWLMILLVNIIMLLPLPLLKLVSTRRS